MVVVFSVFDIFFVELVNGFVVVYVYERFLGFFEFGVVFCNSSGSGRVFKGKVDDMVDDVF